MRSRWLLLAALFAALALVAAACDDLEEEMEAADDDDAEEAEVGETLEDSTIAVGSKDFDEQLLLGWISVLALEDAGADVVNEIDLGGTDASRQALEAGEIDHYWEYTGTAWISFFGEAEPIPDEQEQYEEVRDRDLEENDLAWLEPAPFNNTYALAMSQESYEELDQPETLSDIGPLLEEHDDLVLCVESEFEVRDDGLPGMEETYGYEFDNIDTQDLGLIYESTAESDCTFGEVFTSDGRIGALDLHVLEDDESFFPLYNPAPVFRNDAYEPLADELDELFGPIAEGLDIDTIIELNERVSADGEDPQAVAEDWLTEEGLIGG